MFEKWMVSKFTLILNTTRLEKKQILRIEKLYSDILLYLFLLLKQFNCKFIALDFLDMKKMPIGKKAKHQSTSAIVKQHT